MILKISFSILLKGKLVIKSYENSSHGWLGYGSDINKLYGRYFKDFIY